MQLPSSDIRSALVVAHPSHELRVYGWLELVRPRVFVMTDGSGRSGQPRLSSTTKVLTQVGAQTGSIYGRITDLELYAALLNKNFDLFIKLSDELANSLLVERIECVVGDAAEGYSSAHDICRLVINAAVEMIGLKRGCRISNFDFLVVGPPDEYSGRDGDEAFWIRLDDHTFLRKVATAHDYSPRLAADVDAALKGERFQGIKHLVEPQLAGQVDTVVHQMILAALNSRPELDAQVKGVFSGVELDAFRMECLRPVSDQRSRPDAKETPPFYELYGENLVAAGRYDQVISYRDHIRPLADALWEHVERSV
jgi:hypothetical protein